MAISPQTVVEMFQLLDKSNRAVALQLINDEMANDVKEMSLLEMAEPENVEYMIAWLTDQEYKTDP